MMQNWIKPLKNRLRPALCFCLLWCVRAALYVVPGRFWRRHASLWAGTPILNMAINARAERLLGRPSDSLVFNTYFITSAFNYNLSSICAIPVLKTLVPYLVLLWACVRYDRFHFYCDRGLLNPIHTGMFNGYELALYRSLGKQVVFWTYGADVRTKETTKALGEPNCCSHCPAPGKCCVCDDTVGAANIRQLHAFGSIFSMGDMIEYTPGSRNDLFFWPVDLDRDGGTRYVPCYPDPESTEAVRIVHAPNHRHFKGTQYLIDAVAALKEEGLPVELRLVERVPNDQALEIYRTADIIFDQCLVGYHGYFANEAMAMGKPVLCFIRRPQEYLIAYEACPIQSADPKQLLTLLRELVLDRQRLQALGIAGRRYIEEYYSLPAFARRLSNAYAKLHWESK